MKVAKLLYFSVLTILVIAILLMLISQNKRLNLQNQRNSDLTEVTRALQTKVDLLRYYDLCLSYAAKNDEKFPNSAVELSDFLKIEEGLDRTKSFPKKIQLASGMSTWMNSGLILISLHHPSDSEYFCVTIDGEFITIPFNTALGAKLGSDFPEN